MFIVFQQANCYVLFRIHITSPTKPISRHSLCIIVRSFFAEQVQLARQDIAFIFLILLVLVIEDRAARKIRFSALFLVFGTALVVPHYGITYIFIVSLTGAFFVQSLTAGPSVQSIVKKKSSVKRQPDSRSQQSNVFIVAE